MANIKLVCLGTHKSETDEHEIEAYLNSNDEIFIRIQGSSEECICLDKSTAIRFAKIIRTEINKIGKENSNG